MILFLFFILIMKIIYLNVQEISRLFLFLCLIIYLIIVYRLNYVNTSSYQEYCYFPTDKSLSIQYYIDYNLKNT